MGALRYVGQGEARDGAAARARAPGDGYHEAARDTLGAGVPGDIATAVCNLAEDVAPEGPFDSSAQGDSLALGDIAARGGYTRGEKGTASGSLGHPTPKPDTRGLASFVVLHQRDAVGAKLFEVLYVDGDPVPKPFILGVREGAGDLPYLLEQPSTVVFIERGFWGGIEHRFPLGQIPPQAKP